MNNTGFYIRNYYFRAALYIKLIVDNVKYRGIQCDFGRLTNVFFVTPDSLLFAVQRDTDFFQYTYYGRAFNPAQKGVLNKAGFTLHNPIAIGCMNAIMLECENPELETGNRSLVNGHWLFVTCNLKPVTCNPEPETNENSTVFLTIKPSAMRIIFFAEGRISGSQAIRACLTIRIYNN